MPFLDNLDLVVLQSQFKERDDLGLHKLGGNRPAAYVWELLFNKSYILARLHHTDLIFPAFCLHGNHIVTTALIDPDIELVDLNLPHAFHSCAKMVLKAVGRETQESVDQSILAQDGQQRLFVVECIGPDQLRHSIGEGDGRLVLAGRDTIDLDQSKRVDGTTCQLDHPLHTFGLCLDNACGQLRPKPKGIEQIAQIFW